MNMRILTIPFISLALSACHMAQVSQVGNFVAPNAVEITPQLITSGQPTAQMLSELRDQGFQAVIYLAPPTVASAIPDEALIVGRLGLVFINIPIDFNKPSEHDYDSFAAVLSAMKDKKVLVHCQTNLRASSMVFLYRVIVLKQDPNRAYEAVTEVWVPHDAWKRLIVDVLHKHGIEFEPY
ncbi:MAG: protein tyrosine phosphatase family protein [Gammaproteobacteria bacterium]|nr:protein tyrosine phosphatase family protein [Gammaproteobacteria bacterium]